MTTDAQTEARAIAQTSLWIPAKPEHAKIGWTYDFEQTERISNAAYKSTGYDATMEVVEFVMAEADRRHRDAITTERAAHAETKRERDEAIKAAGEQATLRGEAEGKLAASEMAGIVDGWKRRAEAYRTQRDEALKALDDIAEMTDADNPESYRCDDREGCLDAVHDAARRVREGGKADD